MLADATAVGEVVGAETEPLAQIAVERAEALVVPAHRARLRREVDRVGFAPGLDRIDQARLSALGCLGFLALCRLFIQPQLGEHILARPNRNDWSFSTSSRNRAARRPEDALEIKAGPINAETCAQVAAACRQLRFDVLALKRTLDEQGRSLHRPSHLITMRADPIEDEDNASTARRRMDQVARYSIVAGELEELSPCLCRQFGVPVTFSRWVFVVDVDHIPRGKIYGNLSQRKCGSADHIPRGKIYDNLS